MAKVLDYDGLDHVVDKIYDLINSGGSADYIVEQGKDGGWYYRKWASGVLEAWINSSQSVAMTTNINGQYYGNTTIDISQFGFVEIPTVTVTGRASGAYFGTKIDSMSATSMILSSRASNTATTTVIFSISIRGLWKTFTPSVNRQTVLRPALGFPDYVNRQELINSTISTDQTFTGTFTSDGYVQIHASTDGNVWTPFWRFYINNVMVNEHSKSTTANYLYRWTELFPVRKGDTYSLQLAYSHFRIYFYPIIGD